MHKNLRLPLAALFALSITLPALAGDHHHAAPVGASPKLAYTWLKEGNDRFVSGKFKHGNMSPARRTELSTGQKPHTIILSCSDSRTSPEILFDQGLGDLFVIRTAGNVIDAAGMASIEYAVAHLGARLILVMGHESCGAVKAALDTPPTESAGSKDLDYLVSQIRPNIKQYRTIASEDKTLKLPVHANVNAVADDLTIRSKILRDAVDEGKLAIMTGVYSLKSGKVQFEREKKFMLTN